MSESTWRCSCGEENGSSARFCGSCGARRSTLSPSGAPADAERPDRSGELLDGRFRLSRRLGEGGMGEVYLAQDERLGRQVAIKLLAPELTSSPRAWERMWQEGQTLARIDDVNVVKVFDLFETHSSAGGRTLAMAMEYLPGGDLRDRLRRGPVPPEEACALVSGVLSGLAAIHAAGLVHRDVKPGNVLLAQNGTPKVADLGVARDMSGRMQTRTGQVIGTAEYMSPEQVRGEAVTVQSDLYAAGLLLYELIVGRGPFAGKSEFDLLAAHVQLEPELSELRQRAGASVASIVERALKKDAGQRFESARAMRFGVVGAALRKADVSSALLPKNDAHRSAIGVNKSKCSSLNGQTDVLELVEMSYLAVYNFIQRFRRIFVVVFATLVCCFGLVLCLVLAGGNLVLAALLVAVFVVAGGGLLHKFRGTPK